MTLGAFGAMGGAGPEVRMCSASDDTTDEWCATFAYQWETGMLYGKVGFESGHEVEVTPETENHGAMGDEAKTRGDNPGTDDVNEGGDYSISDLQDGVYTATAASGRRRLPAPHPCRSRELRALPQRGVLGRPRRITRL